MAHRIAELMERAEAAESAGEREAAREACSDLVLRLWARRGQWPYGSPLGRVARALSALVSAPNAREGEGYERDRPESAEGWLGILEAIDRLGNEEFEVVRSAGIAGLDVEAEKAWAERHADQMGDEEREVLGRILELHQAMAGPYVRLGRVAADGFSTKPEGERTALVLDALRKIAAERRTLIRRAARSTGVPQASRTARTRDARRRRASRA